MLADTWYTVRDSLTKTEAALILPRALAECERFYDDPDDLDDAYLTALDCCVIADQPCPAPLLDRILDNEGNHRLASVAVAYLARFRVDRDLSALARVLARTVRYHAAFSYDTFASWRSLSRALIDNVRGFHHRTLAANLLGAMPRIDDAWVQEECDAVFLLMAKRVRHLPLKAHTRLRALIRSTAKSTALTAMVAALRHPAVFPLNMRYDVFLRRSILGFYPPIATMLPELYAADPALAAWAHAVVANDMPELGRAPITVALNVCPEYIQHIPPDAWAWMRTAFCRHWLRVGGAAYPNIFDPLGQCTGVDDANGTYEIEGKRYHIYDLVLSVDNASANRETRGGVLRMWSRALLDARACPRAVRDALAALPFVVRHPDLMRPFKKDARAYLQAAAVRAPNLYAECVHGAMPRLRWNPHTLVIVAQYVPSNAQYMDEMDEILWKHGMLTGCTEVMEGVFARRGRVTEWIARAFLEGPRLHRIPVCPSPCRVALNAMAQYLKTSPLGDAAIVRFLHYVAWSSRALRIAPTGHEARISAAEAPFLEAVMERVPPLDRPRATLHLVHILHHNPALLTPTLARAILATTDHTDEDENDHLWTAIIELAVRAMTRPLPPNFAHVVRHSASRKRTRSSSVVPPLIPDIVRELGEMMGFVMN